MKKTVLLFNFNEKRLSLVKQAVMPLKMGVKVVEKKDFHQVLGYLADIKGFPAAEGEATETFDDEMLVMTGFTGSDVNALLVALKKNNIKIDLKAVMTASNSIWDCVKLHDAVKADHEEMHKNN